MLAFPPILSPEEAVQFNRTLAPYVFSSQILELPARVAEAGTDLQSLLEVYLATNPMLTAIAFALAISPLFVLAAEIRRNYSQVDCWWSILPTIYNVHFYAWALLNGLPTDRLQTVGLFSVAWSVSSLFSFLLLYVTDTDLLAFLGIGPSDLQLLAQRRLWLGR
jgi:hypothetical protein